MFHSPPVTALKSWWLSPLIAGIFLALPQPVPAQDASVGELRKQVVELRGKIHGAKADQVILDLEAKMLDDPVPQKVIKAMPPEVRETAERITRESKILKQTHEDRKEAFEQLEKQIRLQRKFISERWERATAASLDFADDVVDVEEKIGIKWPSTSSSVFWTSIATALVMLTGVVVLALVHIIMLLDYRIALRRRLRHLGRLEGLFLQFILVLPGIAMAALGIRFGLALVIQPEYVPDSRAVSHEKNQRQLREEVDRLKDAYSSLKQCNAAKHTSVNAGREKVLGAWDNVLGRVGPEFRAQEGASFQQFHDVFVDAQATRFLKEELIKTETAYEKDQTDLGRFHEVLGLKWFPWYRVGLIVAFVCISLLPLLIYGRRFLKRIRDARRCPRCGVVGNFKPADTGQTPTLICTAPPDPSGKECNYIFKKSYQKPLCLEFATFGLGQSGKTQSRLILRPLIRKELFPGLKTLETQFDDQGGEEKSVPRGKKPAATQIGLLPYPLWFSLHDRDWLGQADVNIRLFDYSGEISKGEKDFQEYKRVLGMNGLLYFWDPTKDFDEQLMRFDRFLQYRAEILGSRSKRRSIAFCISRLDELPLHNPKTRKWIENLGEIGDEAVDLAAEGKAGSIPWEKIIQERHQYICDGLDFVFSGNVRDNTIWKTQSSAVHKKLMDHLGDNYCFFPMTTRSFAPSYLTTPGVEKESLAPYGVLEPFLWLISQNGYDVFSLDQSTQSITGGKDDRVAASSQKS